VSFSDALLNGSKSAMNLPVRSALGLAPSEAGRELPLDVRKEPLRVALVTSSYNYIKDGVALTLNRFVEYLLSQHVEVLVFAPVGPKPAFEAVGKIVTIPSVPLPLRPEYRVALGLPRSAGRTLRDFRPDIVHIAVPDLLGYGALMAAQALNVPVVASYHTRYETYLKHYRLGVAQPLLESYLDRFYDACRELYVPSPSMVEVLKARGLQVEMHLWPRGVDSSRFHPSKRSTAWRARWGIGADEVVVLFVSRLVREKQLETLTAVLRILKDDAPPFRSVVVGEGPERKSLEKRLPGTLFTGFLDGDDLAQAYASADIFLFPSETESFGNVTLEAMACGLPAVCADATGSRSLVVPDVTGFLVEPGDSDGFVTSVRQLLSDPALRERMGAAARERSLEFGWEDPMRRILQRYEALLQ
jgi:phosphatidylinositol alpha 1,6-mannosyltransferase